MLFNVIILCQMVANSYLGQCRNSYLKLPSLRLGAIIALISQSSPKLLELTSWFFIVKLILLVFVWWAILFFILIVIELLFFLLFLANNKVSSTFLRAFLFRSTHHEHLRVDIALSYFFGFSPRAILSLGSWKVGVNKWYLPFIIDGAD